MAAAAAWDEGYQAAWEWLSWLFRTAAGPCLHDSAGIWRAAGQAELYAACGN